MLEQEAIGTSKDPFVKRQIIALMDFYAEEFDELLKYPKVGLTDKLKILTLSLLVDLEKVTKLSNEVD